MGNSAVVQIKLRKIKIIKVSVPSLFSLKIEVRFLVWVNLPTFAF
jgi:hypothetical protein